MKQRQISIKDIEDIVGETSIDIWVENKWVCVQFSHVRFKIPLKTTKTHEKKETDIQKQHALV